MLPLRKVDRMDGRTDGRKGRQHNLTYLLNSCYAFSVPRAFHAHGAPLIINMMINALLNHL